MRNGQSHDADPNQADKKAERKAGRRERVLQRIGERAFFLRDRVTPLDTGGVNAACCIHAGHECAQQFDNVGTPGALIRIDAHLHAPEPGRLRFPFQHRALFRQAVALFDQKVETLDPAFGK